MKITASQLEKLFGLNGTIALEWADAFNQMFVTYGIDTPLRVAHFVSQVGHESSGLKRLEENLNYSTEGLLKTFKKYFDGPTATKYARRPQMIANRVYANRMGNGSEASGDGWTYRGRGPIQITGKDNYTRLSKDTGVDFLTLPDMLKDPYHGAMSAAWFWKTNGLNALADRDDVVAVTKRINGGTIGLEDRKKELAHAKAVFGA